MECGREPDGAKVSEFGVCLAATDIRAGGINHGENAGRSCWAVAGTFCRGKVQGSYAKKLGDCEKCRFYKRVIKEEGAKYVTADDILRELEKRDLHRYFLKHARDK
ncbi:hypothetical protein BMS3Abin10_00907 [bacterium BMS3Abin10]|nr:hypothetical protein BMS3Abin10_00907 [bacterium BMS3Abin10]GBE37663.1 hypothetical protein BMS3Bbin08_00254 [bacterium BMS3Bbin08]HDH50016.1 hypothetical protein [Nitrospirota bacterium]